MTGLLKRCVFIPLLAVAFLGIATAAQPQQTGAKSQEVSDVDGEPVLLKHLPAYDNVRNSAVFVTSATELRKAVGDQPVLDVPDFPLGTEAVTADYPAGRLVIVEYTNPQASIEADGRIQQFLTANPQPGVVYRRIGNYNAFVFGVGDQPAAIGLLDQVKYEKSVQWLGEDPYLLRRVERYLMLTSRDIVLSTVEVIVLGLVSSAVAGVIAGFIFFRVRDQKRSQRSAFSDAGGLTRLNLDGLSE